MNIDKILSMMTLEEKASLLSGENFWFTKKSPRLDIEQIMVSDGPHGLRQMDISENKDNPDFNDSIKAVCFPTASSLACSFDRNLLKKLGKALGYECQAQGVSVILGPGTNIKRSPLCGRNFEYFSEDPYLATELATAHINGVQSRGVGTSLKHFAMNNQEKRRMSVSSEVDERTMREIYLAAFEGAVKNAKPWTVMCSYNRINGIHASQNKWLLTDVLRNEWGYNGLVMSDWGAVDDRVLGVKAGLDLEMPASMGKNDKRIVEAVLLGKLSIDDVNKACKNVLELVKKSSENKIDGIKWDKEKDHELARKIESECMVLLKNEDNILPISKDENVAFIGKFAKVPRYQGGGSSHINSFKVESALDYAKEKGLTVTYAQGYITEEDKTDKKLVDEAVKLAKKSDVAVLFLGLTDIIESEGYDRNDMKMPNCQIELLKAVKEANENIVVVLHNGSPVEMDWLEDTKALLEAYLGGQAVGGAEVEILFGDKCPSGKLAETFPERLEDNPSFLNYPGEGDTVEYKEGIFVGYRYYEKKKIKPLFPFGFGLSYTTFEYSDILINKDEMNDDEEVTVSLTVKNTGNVNGKEIVQLYVKDTESSVIRPEKELKGFEKVSLKPGEEKRVAFILNKRSFAYYNTDISDWYTEYGKYEILVGSSSDDIRQKTEIYVSPTNVPIVKYTLNNTFGDVLSTPTGEVIFKDVVSSLVESANYQDRDLAGSELEMIKAIFGETPIRAIVSFCGVESITRELLSSLIRQLNIAINEGLDF